jgi:hypothetical protein
VTAGANDGRVAVALAVAAARRRAEDHEERFIDVPRIGREERT